MRKKVICHDIYGNKKEVDISKLSFRPAVYGILIEKGKILLSKQWDGYDFPGGSIEIHETIDKALKREFWEETGLKVKKGKIVACESSFFDSVSKKFVNSILIYYLCKKISGQLSIKNIVQDEKDYINQPEWIALNKVKQIKFYNSVDSVKIIKQAIEIKK